MVRLRSTETHREYVMRDQKVRTRRTATIYCRSLLDTPCSGRVVELDENAPADTPWLCEGHLLDDKLMRDIVKE